MIFRLLLVCLLFALHLHAQPSFEVLARQAQQAMEADRVPEAIDLFRRAVAMRPEWSEGWWHLGTLLFDGERFAESRDALKRLVALEPKAGPAFAMIGLCDFQLKQYEPALTALEHGRRLGLGSNQDFARRAVYVDGILQSLLGHPEAGLGLLTLLADQTAATHPGPDAKDLVLSDLQLVDAIGIAALRMAKLPSQIPPEKSVLVRQAGRARALFEIKDWVAAEEEFKKLVESFPAEPGVHYAYGLFLLKVHPELAIGEFRKEIDVSPKDVGARVQIALQSLSTGEYEPGRKCASEAVTLQPGNFAAHVIYSRVLLALENVNAALKEAQTAVKLAPDSPDAHFVLSRCYTQAGKMQDAERERKEFERLQPR